ncbi:MAG TPA: ankyrin repeat domain-containing protein, partial [Rhodospirillales bacterium]|nr:ankyrin repeat domain-containing protein [Rhodospirillales bacterium]
MTGTTVIWPPGFPIPWLMNSCSTRNPRRIPSSPPSRISLTGFAGSRQALRDGVGGTAVARRRAFLYRFYPLVINCYNMRCFIHSGNNTRRIFFRHGTLIVSAGVHFIALTAPPRRLFAAVSVALLLAFCGGAAAAQTVFTDEASAATKSLFAAVRKNDLPAVQSAITAGADIEAVNSWGLTPVDLAVDKGNYEIAHFILSLRTFRAKPSASAGTGAKMRTQPQLPRRSSGAAEGRKSLGYGVIS